MMKSAFISYSTDASTKANQVSGYLKPLGVDTFVFEKDLGKRGAARLEYVGRLGSAMQLS